MTAGGGPPQVVEFGPETKRSLVLPILFSVPALIVFWLAGDVALMTQGREPRFVAGMVLIGVVLLGIGGLLWRAEPFWQGRLRITPEGVELEQWKRNRIPPQRVPWRDVAALRKRSVPRQPDFFGIELRGAREPRFNKVLWLSAWGIETRGRDVIAALRDGARAAGYGTVGGPSWRSAFTERRWPLEALQNGPADADG